MTTSTVFERKDFLSDQEPRWCQGCGDYGILKGFSTALSKIGISPEKFVIVSGIGCSSRFPHYTSAYGFHSIHGRAPAIATGIKLSRPDLSVWVITGDGDGLSIGGNHFIHMMRRNPDIKLVLLNNRIYGLTKGQISPTSPQGTKTKSTPYGSVDKPINPMKLAIAAGATFAARVPDTDNAMMTEVFIEAHKHKGVSFIEVLQTCTVFYEDAWTNITKKSNRPENTVLLKHGEPLIFGEKQNKSFRPKGFDLEQVNLDDPGVDRSQLLLHDAHCADPTLALKLSFMEPPNAPYPLGIFRQISAPVYEEQVATQERETMAKLGRSNLHKFLHSGETWVVSGNGNGAKSPA